jgi:DNA-binding Lrp family transcriptional regulator
MVDELDKKLISHIQKDLPLDPRPFALIADEIGLSEDELIKRIKSMIKEGVIRRFGATLYHQEAGFSSNAMVAWVVPEGQITETGKAMAKFREVTHCYERRPQKDWRYNIYTMIHGDSRDECYEIARRISDITGIREFNLLFSEKEFKKSSMEYF